MAPIGSLVRAGAVATPLVSFGVASETAASSETESPGSGGAAFFAQPATSVAKSIEKKSRRIIIVVVPG
jgi:hypothetical protein